ncbi:hypothetical protein HY090_01550 [Candidatus Kaiserbacteria bacterium]|nr:hypothetical protein [Candidatus Kaiserbacteria bacterium]
MSISKEKASELVGQEVYLETDSGSHETGILELAADWVAVRRPKPGGEPNEICSLVVPLEQVERLEPIPKNKQ